MVFMLSFKIRPEGVVAIIIKDVCGFYMHHLVNLVCVWNIANACSRSERGTGWTAPGTDRYRLTGTLYYHGAWCTQLYIDLVPSRYGLVPL